MKNNDAALIQRVLEGDDTAFSALVKKYQRSVHALAWRKIGDFHIAEGHHTRYIPEGVSETLNTEETAAFRELALCHSSEPLQYMAP